MGRWLELDSLCVWIVKVLPRREVSWGRVEFPALPDLGFEGRDCGFRYVKISLKNHTDVCKC